MTHPLLERAHTLASDLVEIRRDLHRHPELSYREHRTAGVVAEALQEGGWRVHRGVARTGVVAELEVGATPASGPEGAGPTVALRADMDALPIQEEGEHPWRSSVPGVMHACGHDAHCATLLGAARLLRELDGEGRLRPGRIRLLFQPSEETMDDQGMSGARRMVAEGVMEGVSAVVGLHVGAHLPLGGILMQEGPLFAGSDEVRITVHGRSAHAGRPHEGVDALALAAQGLVGVQRVVARELGPWEQGVLSFGTIEGGSALNAVPDRVALAGTLRYFEADVRGRLIRGLRGAFAHVEPAGGRLELEIREGYPPVVNDPALTARLRPVLDEIAGPDPFLAPVGGMEAEDFSYLAREAPGVFFWLGAALPEPRRHHHPRFDIDEAVLPLGAALLAGAARTLLDGGASGS